MHVFDGCPIQSKPAANTTGSRNKGMPAKIELKEPDTSYKSKCGQRSWRLLDVKLAIHVRKEKEYRSDKDKG